MKIRPFADEDGYTTFSNYMLDVIMPSLPANAWKVLCFIVRKTRGWQKDMDRLSYGQIETGAGIGSSATISAAIKVLLEKGLIVKVPGNAWTSMGYRINSALEIEVLDNSTSETKALETEVHSALETEVPVLQKLKTQKERSKEKKETEDQPPSFFVTIAEACRIDLSLCTDRQKGQIAQAVKKLTKAGKTPEEIPKVLDYWYTIDWRGKKGDAPRPDQIVEAWHPATTQEAYTNGHRNGSHIRQGTRKHSERGKLSEANRDPERGF